MKPSNQIATGHRCGHWFGLLSLGLLAGCITPVTPPHEINAKFRDVIHQRQNEYVFKPGDTLGIEMDVPDPALQQLNLTVLPDGRTDLNYLNNYKIAGKTLDQVEIEFKERFEQYMQGSREKELRIQVTPAPEVVYLVGQFRRPLQRIEPVVLSSRMTLQEAISSANGMAITGDTDWALLRRPYLDPLHPDLFRIDLNDWTEDIYLLPGDQIQLDRNFLAAVVTYIRTYIFGIVPTNSPLFAALF